MKSKVIIVTIVLGFLLSFNCMPLHAAGEERLPDIMKLLVAYGCLENWQSRYGSSLITKAKIFDNYDLASIEADTSLLDTPEELITVGYLSHTRTSFEVRGLIQDELPEGTVGGLRLTSMWLKKMAEHPENTTSYQKVINIIKRHLALTDAVIKEYFAKAVENEILKRGKNYLAKWYSSSQLKESICQPIIVYYIDPTKSNKDRIVSMGVNLINENQDKGDGYITVLIKLNDSLATEIINKIHTARLK
jgi:hypothetical protein